MWSEIAPDQCHNIAVEGYNVVAYQFGDGEETVLCLNGGPGLRQWVDDAGAAPGDLDAAAARDEAEWSETRAPFLLY